MSFTASRSHDRRWPEGPSQLTGAAPGEVVDLPTATQCATERICEISGADYAAITLTDRSPLCLVCQAGSGLDTQLVVTDPSPHGGLAGKAVNAGRSLVTEDVSTDLPDDAALSWGRPLSVLGVTIFMPLDADGEVLGNLLVGWRRDRTRGRLAAREAESLRTLADQTACELRRVWAQEDRRRRERWLEGASAMAPVLFGQVDSNEAMRLVIRQLRETLRADVAGVMLVDQDDPESMYVVTFEGIDGAEAPPNPRIPRDGLLARVIVEGKRIVRADYPNLLGYRPPAGWAETLSRIGLGMQVPLVADGVPLGTLFVGWHRDSPYARAARADVEQVQAVADIVAPTIAGRDVFSELLTLHASSNGSAALTNLLLAAIMAERDRAKRGSEAACAQLMEAIARLDQVKGVGADHLRAFIARHSTRPSGTTA